jgi:hypothetical protein
MLVKYPEYALVKTLDRFMIINSKTGFHYLTNNSDHIFSQTLKLEGYGIEPVWPNTFNKEKVIQIKLNPG